MELKGIHKRWIVTAYNSDGNAYRYMAESESDATRQVGIFADMGLSRCSKREVLWDNRKSAIV